MQIGILGGGAFGTSLAKNLTSFSQANHGVTLYCIEKELVDIINSTHINSFYLPHINLSHKVVATNNLQDMYQCDIVFLTVPVKFITEIIKQLHNYPTNIPLIIGSKGIDINEGKLPSTLLEEGLGKSISLGVLTGPTFATEIAENMVSALLLATNNLDSAENLIHKINFSNIRIYKSDDIIGCQVGGAIKNIIAIAAGVIKGLNLGHNALAGLITRGVNEIATVITSYGGKKQTAYGLSGLGDLVLTATSPESRNFSLGLAIAKAQGYTHSLNKDKPGISEGYFTVKAVYNKIINQNLYLPICREVYKVLYENKDPNQCILDILNAPIKSEF